MHWPEFTSQTFCAVYISLQQADSECNELNYVERRERDVVDQLLMLLQCVCAVIP